jgi:hypothetical protein
MSHKALPPLSQECVELRDQLETWRKTREKRRRLPEAIWESAARLAKEFGINRIARELHLSYATLKKRMNGPSGKNGKGARATHAFVEVEMSPASSRGGIVVELVKSSGTRMRIELTSGHVGDLMAMVKTFCGAD